MNYLKRMMLLYSGIEIETKHAQCKEKSPYHKTVVNDEAHIGLLVQTALSQVREYFTETGICIVFDSKHLFPYMVKNLNLFKPLNKKKKHTNQMPPYDYHLYHLRYSVAKQPPLSPTKAHGKKRIGTFGSATKEG